MPVFRSLPSAKFFSTITSPLALTALMAISAPALAYDPADCSSLSGGAATAAANEFTLETSAADFGDGPRIFDNLDDAVVCWYGDGRVGVMGKLYLDKITGPFQTVVTVAFSGDGRRNRQVSRLAFTNLVKGEQKIVAMSKPGNFYRAQVVISIVQDAGRRPIVREVANRFFTR